MNGLILRPVSEYWIESANYREKGLFWTLHVLAFSNNRFNQKSTKKSQIDRKTGLLQTRCQKIVILADLWLVRVIFARGWPWQFAKILNKFETRESQSFATKSSKQSRFRKQKSPKSVVYLWIEHIVAFVTKIYRHFSLFLFLSRNSAPYPSFHFFGESTSPLSFRGEWATLTQKKSEKMLREKLLILVENERHNWNALFQSVKAISLVTYESREFESFRFSAVFGKGPKICNLENKSVNAKI